MNNAPCSKCHNIQMNCEKHRDEAIETVIEARTCARDIISYAKLSIFHFRQLDINSNFISDFNEKCDSMQRSMQEMEKVLGRFLLDKKDAE